MNKQKAYARFRAHGHDALRAWCKTVILSRWDELEKAGLVRLASDEEQESYFDVYGTPDDEKERKSIEHYLDLWGCFCVYTEYKGVDGEWRPADSIGMCVYEDATDPFDNEYVVDLMDAAIDFAVNEHFVADGASI